MPPFNFDELPSELNLMVVEFLSKKELYQLSQVNNSFFTLTKDRLKKIKLKEAIETLKLRGNTFLILVNESKKINTDKSHSQNTRDTMLTKIMIAFNLLIKQETHYIQLAFNSIQYLLHDIFYNIFQRTTEDLGIHQFNFNKLSNLLQENFRLAGHYNVRFFFGLNVRHNNCKELQVESVAKLIILKNFYENATTDKLPEMVKTRILLEINYLNAFYETCYSDKTAFITITPKGVLIKGVPYTQFLKQSCNMILNPYLHWCDPKTAFNRQLYQQAQIMATKIYNEVLEKLTAVAENSISGDHADLARSLPHSC